MKNITFVILLTAIVLVIVWVFIASEGNSQEYSEHSCLITTGDKNCNLNK
jgi:hypothetical protein